MGESIRGGIEPTISFGRIAHQEKDVLGNLLGLTLENAGDVVLRVWWLMVHDYPQALPSSERTRRVPATRAVIFSRAA